MYAIPLSVIAALVFAAIAVAQDVQKGQQAGQEPSPTTTDTTQQMCKVQRPCQQNRTLLRQPHLPRAAHPPLTAQQLEELYLLTPRASTQPSSASLQALPSRS